MRNAKRIYGKAAWLILIVLTLAFGATAQQQQTRLTGADGRKIELGRGMSLINADLMQIAAETDLFLRLADKVSLSGEQVKKLGDLYIDLQKYAIRRQADLDVADAELRRLVNNDRVDLAAVRAKVKEIESLESEFTMKKIETVLLAVGTLTHDQHLKILLLVRELLEQKLLSPSDAPQS
jgi:Spy/CpxP family protein refolding chaperone